MTDRESLLAAIIANPDEDTPRLMYADWLMEHGEADRGEFIRLQVEAAQTDPFSPQALAHEEAAEKLLERNAEKWTRHIAECVIGWRVAHGVAYPRFARGFVEHVIVNAETFARDAAALFAVEPIRSLQVIRYATRTAGQTSLDSFFTVPQLSRIARLDCTALGEPVDYFEKLATCPHLANLTGLILRKIAVPPPWLRALLAGSALPRLAGLDLAGITNLFRVLAEAFPCADHRRFVRLDLSNITFQSDHLQKILSSRCASEVEELRLGWTEFADAGPLTHVNLGWVIPWNRLRLLDLNGQGVGNEGVREIVAELSRWPDIAPLRWLGLANNRIGSEGVRALIDSDESRLKLYHIDLRGNPVTAAYITVLKSRFPEAVVHS